MKVKLSGSFRRYFASMSDCDLSPDPLEEGLAEALNERRFRSIDGPSGETVSFGWAMPDGVVPDFGEYEPWLGSILYLGLRIDTKRLHGGALRVRRLEREAVERREVSEKISPDRRREIKEEVEQELLARTVPATSVHPMLWDTSTGQVLFSGTSDAANVPFQGLFRETFGRALRPVLPTPMAERLAESLGLDRALDGVVPLDLAMEREL